MTARMKTTRTAAPIKRKRPSINDFKSKGKVQYTEQEKAMITAGQAVLKVLKERKQQNEAADEQK